MLRKPHGADVSQYNVGNTFEGLGFVVIRASSADGGLHEDSQVDEHVKLARRHRIPFGLYHFAANEDPIAQANLIVGTAQRLGALRKGDIGIVIDCEAALDTSVAQQVINATKGQLNRSPSVHRTEVGIYSGNWVKERGGETFGADWGWVAQWGTDRPTLPRHWHRGFTRLWQYAGNGTDRDLYRGSHRSFKRWLDR